jgi:diaminohydroxyphosphoribosylaminopyrimidine deaminase/5-amino-6-(5-phosphoribosylamino)uracil reductase
MEDPNPQVSGQGLALLRAAQIEVRCGLLAHEAHELNLGFISRMTRQQPWVRVKIAASLDGRTALPNGESQWITSPAARADSHLWRARACAILTGIGTVRKDNPQLTVRGVDTPRQPLRVLVDSRLDVPLNAHLLNGQAPLLIVCASTDATRTQKAHELRARGAEVIPLASHASTQVDLPALLHLLGERGINELQVEAGQGLNGALLQQHCIDELLIYLAPSLLCDAQGMFKLVAPATLAQRITLSFQSVERVGRELRILARVGALGDKTEHECAIDTA